MRWPRRGLGALRSWLLVASLLVTGAAHAQIAAAPEATPPPPTPPERRTASLGWVRLPGASTCSGGAEIARRVEVLLRREALVPPSRADLAIEARVERVRARARYRVVVEVADAAGEVVGARTIESPGDDCRRLDEPVALALALMIDPEAATRPPPPPPAPPPPPMIAVHRDILLVPIAVQVERAPPPPPTLGTGPTFAVALGPSLALGIVPGAAPGARLGVEVGPPADLQPTDLVWGPSSVRVGVAGYGGSLEVVGDRPGEEATLRIGAVLPRLEACPTTAFVGERAAFGACVALDVGVFTWTGEGFDSPVASGTEATADLGPALHARVVLVEPLSLEARGAAVIPFVRDRFVYRRGEDATGIAHQPAPVGGTLEVGVHLGFDP